MKRFTAVLLSVLLLFLVACDKGENSQPVSSSPSSSNTILSEPSSSNTVSSKEESSIISSSAPSSKPSSRPSSSKPSSVISSSAPSSSQASSSTPGSSVPGSSSSLSSSSAPSSSQTISSSTSSVQDPAPEEKPSVYEDHYCYGNLTPIQKQYYNSMHTAVHDMFTSWVVLGELSDNYVKDIAVVRHALISDHPEVFWLPPYYITATGKDDNGDPAALIMFSSSADVSPAFLVKRSEKAVMEKELNDAVLDIASLVTATDPFEIELQLHDILCSRVEYSTDESDPMIYSAYGALINGKALCEGYSRAMQLLLHHFKIPCTTVTGVAGGDGHMWNLVSIGSKWYNLDVTWDDTSKDFISHEYFNLTDADISLDHTFSKDFSELNEKDFEKGTIAFNHSRPLCDSYTNNYFTKRGLVFSKDNTKELVNYIKNSEKQMIEVRFSNTSFKKEFNSNSSTYLEKINNELFLQNPESDYYIGRYSVSSLTLKLYKTKNQ